MPTIALDNRSQTQDTAQKGYEDVAASHWGHNTLERTPRLKSQCHQPTLGAMARQGPLSEDVYSLSQISFSQKEWTNGL